MKISYQWLKDYINLDVTPKILEDHLTFAGIEVEAIERLGAELEQIKVAEVVECDNMPNSDHLHITQIEDGTGELKQVVCGAPNCRKGLKVAFAPVGAILDGGNFKIKKAKLRGIASFGMLCSEKELNLSDEHAGIMELSSDAVIGSSLASYLNLDDVVFDVEITPNRPDLLGMLGVARDLSALYNIELKVPELKEKKIAGKVESLLSVENKNADKCKRYSATLIKNVSVKESPDWLIKRLQSVGLKSINNVVDVTNFVLMELGHPLHAFDYAKVVGNKIIVRDAKEGETFKALNGLSYTLSSDDLVIADSEKAIGLAGVMGGLNSEITSETKDIVLEAACFNYSTVRRTSQRQKLFSDSSYRYERGISPESTDYARMRAIDLILEVAGGELYSLELDSFPGKDSLNDIISLRPSRVNRIIGTIIPIEEIKDYMKALELRLIDENAETLRYEVPPFRADLGREIDLIEEIVRLHGYNKVPEINRLQGIMNISEFRFERKVKDLMVNCGLYETINISLTEPELLNKLKLAETDYRRKHVKLMNPQSNLLSVMRSSLIPQILQTTAYNVNHGTKDVRIFELNRIYLQPTKEGKLSTEKKRLTVLMTGNRFEQFWKNDLSKCDFFDVKGVAEDLMDMTNLDYHFKPSVEPFYIEGMSLNILHKKEILGSFGQLDSKVCKEFDLDTVDMKQDLYILDIDLERIYELMTYESRVFNELNKFPTMQRDLSFNVEKSISVEDLEKCISNTNRGIIRNVDLFDQYEGKNIPKGKRSLTFSIVFGSDKKTLKDSAIDQIVKKVIANLEKQYSIEMR